MHTKCALQKRQAALVSLHLAAGCFEDGPFAQRDQGIQIQFMFLRYRPSHGVDESLPVIRGLVELGDYHQSLLAAFLHRKSGAGIRANPGMALLHRPFNILRVMIDAAGNDEILQASSHVQLAFPDKSQIASAQKLSQIGRIAQAHLKYRGAFLCAPPITRCHARIGHPYFAHLVDRAAPSGLRIHNLQLEITHWWTATHQASGDCIVSGRHIAAISLQRGGIDFTDIKWLIVAFSRDHKRGFS